MGLKGIKKDGTTYRFDYTYLDNLPEVPSAQDILPAVTSSDAGKFLRVNAEGAWIAAELPSAEEASF